MKQPQQHQQRRWPPTRLQFYLTLSVVFCVIAVMSILVGLWGGKKKLHEDLARTRNMQEGGPSVRIGTIVTFPPQTNTAIDLIDPDPRSNIQLTITMAKRFITSIHTAFYILPPGSSSNNNVLLLFHGCSHSAEDWLDLPEERRIVKHALSLNLIVVAISSLSRVSGCWMDDFPLDANKDVMNVVDVINELKSREDTLIGKDSKWFALGASSGGTFASILASQPNLGFAGVIIYVSPGSTKIWQQIASDISHGVAIKYPSTCFVSMERDETWASTTNIGMITPTLRKGGVIVNTYVILARKISPAFFYNRIDLDMSMDLSGEVYKALLKAGHISPGTGRLSTNPRLFRMKNVMPHLPEQQLARIAETLNERWAEHELSSAYFLKCIQEMLH